MLLTHRVVEVGRDFWRSSGPRAACPAPHPGAFEHLRGWRLCHLCGQPVPVLTCGVKSSTEQSPGKLQAKWMLEMESKHHLIAADDLNCFHFILWNSFVDVTVLGSWPQKLPSKVLYGTCTASVVAGNPLVPLLPDSCEKDLKVCVLCDSWKASGPC